MSEELAQIDAVGQAELVRNGEVSPLELVDAGIDRLERLNPRLNAVIHSALQLARDRAFGVLQPDGPARRRGRHEAVLRRRLLQRSTGQA